GPHWDMMAGVRANFHSAAPTIRIGTATQRRVNHDRRRRPETARMKSSLITVNVARAKRARNAFGCARPMPPATRTSTRAALTRARASSACISIHTAASPAGISAYPIAFGYRTPNPKSRIGNAPNAVASAALDRIAAGRPRKKADARAMQAHGQAMAPIAMFVAFTATGTVAPLSWAVRVTKLCHAFG